MKLNIDLDFTGLDIKRTTCSYLSCFCTNIDEE